MLYKKGTFAVVPVQQISGIDPLAQVVYMWICFHTNQDGNCFPSQKLLSSETGISVTTIKDKLKLLEGLNLLVRTKRNRKDGGKSADFYQILLNEAENKTEDLPPPSPDAYTPPSPDAYHITILNKEPYNTVANATPSIKLGNEIYSMEELEYIPEHTPNKKTKYGRKSIAMLVRAFAESAGIEIRGTFDAAPWSKPLGAIYQYFDKDVDESISFIKRAAKYFKEEKMSFTPHTLHKDLPMIDKWIAEKNKGQQNVDVNRRKL